MRNQFLLNFPYILSSLLIFPTVELLRLCAVSYGMRLGQERFSILSAGTCLTCSEHCYILHVTFDGSTTCRVVFYGIENSHSSVISGGAEWFASVWNVELSFFKIMVCFTICCHSQNWQVLGYSYFCFWCASRFAQYSVMNGISIVGTTSSIFILVFLFRRVLIGRFWISVISSFLSG